MGKNRGDQLAIRRANNPPSVATRKAGELEPNPQGLLDFEVGTNTIRNAELRRILGTNALLKVDGGLIFIPLISLPDEIRSALKITLPEPRHDPEEKIHTLSVQQIKNIFIEAQFYQEAVNKYHPEDLSFRKRGLYSKSITFTIHVKNGRVTGIGIGFGCSPRGAEFPSAIDFLARNFMDLTGEEIAKLKSVGLTLSQRAVLKSMRVRRRKRGIIDTVPEPSLTIWRRMSLFAKGVFEFSRCQIRSSILKRRC